MVGHTNGEMYTCLYLMSFPLILSICEELFFPFFFFKTDTIWDVTDWMILLMSIILYANTAVIMITMMSHRPELWKSNKKTRSLNDLKGNTPDPMLSDAITDDSVFIFVFTTANKGFIYSSPVRQTAGDFPNGPRCLTAATRAPQADKRPGGCLLWQESNDQIRYVRTTKKRLHLWMSVVCQLAALTRLFNFTVRFPTSSRWFKGLKRLNMHLILNV